jgi:DNA-binding response OmpR family regulator
MTGPTERPARILVVEDETELRGVMERHLTGLGYEVLGAGTLGEARAALWEYQPDLLLLDVMLPDGSGYDLCAQMRGLTSAPIIYVTSLAKNSDTVRGLAAGGDDYITKPFDLDVLAARVAAQLRRLGAPGAGRIDLPPMHLDLVAGRVTLEGETITLTPRELALLAYFAANAGRGLTQQELLRAVWSDTSGVPTNTVRTHISSLRRKLHLDGASPFELALTPDRRYVFHRLRFTPPSNAANAGIGDRGGL